MLIFQKCSFVFHSAVWFALHACVKRVSSYVVQNRVKQFTPSQPCSVEHKFYQAAIPRQYLYIHLSLRGAHSYSWMSSNKIRWMNLPKVRHGSPGFELGFLWLIVWYSTTAPQSSKWCEPVMFYMIPQNYITGATFNAPHVEAFTETFREITVPWSTYPCLLCCLVVACLLVN